MRSIRALGALSVPVALYLATTANAASLHVIASDLCLDNDKPYRVVGLGFGPERVVTIGGFQRPSASFTDPTGRFQAIYRTPDESSFTPRTVTLTASDGAQQTASLAVQVVRFGSNVPVDSGPANERVNWRFAGYPGGRTLYGHFRWRGRTVRNFRFGKTEGLCGTLVKRAPRLPAKWRPGKWTLQIDTRPLYSVYTRPAFRGTFQPRRPR